ncbi:MAG: AmmeMemoRadiSam system protein B [Candidatus Omnitrophota bacterium]
MRLKLFLILLFLFLFSSPAFCQDIKDSDLAGTWYPANSQKLYNQIKGYLEVANPPQVSGEVLAIISPHAGLQYSGPVAAYGFKLVQNKKIDTVIVVGFSHRKDYDGIAVFNKDGIRTPLGVLYTNKELRENLLKTNKKIFGNSIFFEDENSIELTLPFIQAALGNPKIVLLAIGNQTLESCEVLGTSLYEILKGEKDFLIVASTDMSHYLPYEQAIGVDSEAINLIKEFEPEKLFLASSNQNRMCGLATVTSTMIAAKKLGASSIEILREANSGDSTLDKSRVVGYLSAAFLKETDKTISENNPMKEKDLLTKEQKQKLLKIARNTITHYLTTGKVLEVKEDDPLLKKPMGAFVTLHKKGELRGCIGHIEAIGPLYITVRDMAIASATEDPRFSPVTKEELKDIHIEISVLSPLKKTTNTDEIIMGKHGVIVKDFFRSGVYLPQVATETGWSKEEFMNSLCGQKAGMSIDAWKRGKCDIYIFSAEVFAE